jgi:hypothetical protein
MKYGSPFLFLFGDLALLDLLDPVLLLGQETQPVPYYFSHHLGTRKNRHAISKWIKIHTMPRTLLSEW